MVALGVWEEVSYGEERLSICRRETEREQQRGYNYEGDHPESNLQSTSGIRFHADADWILWMERRVPLILICHVFVAQIINFAFYSDYLI